MWLQLLTKRLEMPSWWCLAHAICCGILMPAIGLSQNSRYAGKITGAITTVVIHSFPALPPLMFLDLQLINILISSQSNSFFHKVVCEQGLQLNTEDLEDFINTIASVSCHLQVPGKPVPDRATSEANRPWVSLCVHLVLVCTSSARVQCTVLL